MRLAVISDSHIPTRASAIPSEFLELIEQADHVIHAGDFESPDALTTIREVAPNLTAVHGNADPIDLGLPAVAAVTIDDVTFVATHGTRNLAEAAVFGTDGVTWSGEEWARAVADTARVRTRSWDGSGIIGIGGHTHRVEDTTVDGVRVLNPGSVTGADPAEVASMMTVVVDDGSVDVTVHEAHR